ncbi:putative surface protein with fasciclin (FAS1) repeats [Mucilaginibacter oryzae]|uniref:Putative surface protein with fasciclin (FAS1) repeats n=1 Tax=Mucilaginibacter oryzae TaxID=468058 RepID=A0A316HAZ1_9SPHI|nr:fasciclin domain-containing protein [Mucilaginibacter oryzae]PWK78284.1 putative surface protein with fasciclin (FAS1) repeats [Mucilaginibacter oryzae]
MKKLLLSVSMLFYSALLFAQANDKNGAPVIPVMLPTNDIVKNISLIPNMSRFASFIRKTNLMRTYTSRGPITVFVPVDEGYTDMPAGKLDSLSKPGYIWDLTDLVTYHALAGEYKLKEIRKQINKHKGVATFTTLSGGILTAKFDSNSNIILVDANGGEIMINQPDIAQNNGIIHVVNKVLIPKKRVI